MIRIKGRLGATALSAFPTMVAEVEGSNTVLTGSLTDRSAVFGVLAQIEALGLELIELRQIRARPKSPESRRQPLNRCRVNPGAHPNGKSCVHNN